MCNVQTSNPMPHLMVSSIDCEVPLIRESTGGLSAVTCTQTLNNI